MTAMFIKAEKRQAKLRLAIDGPSGSGKTYTALVAATALAKGAPIAVIDTERNSASLYADLFAFDVAALDSYHPRNYIDLIAKAEDLGYAVIVIDSLSHAWEGEGGVLDLHDQATKRQRSENSYTAWKDVTPIHRALIDAMLQSKCHIIATMRSKTEYVIETNSNGKQVPRKVGMAPVQRQGMEYEFTIVGDMDVDHNLMITKTRCPAITDAVVNKPGPDFFAKIDTWLNTGAEALPQPERKNGNQPPEEKSLAELIAEAENLTTKKGTRLGDLTDEQLALVRDGENVTPQYRDAAVLILDIRRQEQPA